MGCQSMLKVLLVSLLWSKALGKTSFNPKTPCEKGSCLPATGNLLIGRAANLTASSTCGLYREERYCIVSHLEKKKCFSCDSRPNAPPDRSHRIENVIYKDHTIPGLAFDRSWWQSENGKEDVTIQLDMEAEFHFTHMIVKFNTFRPAAMIVERSHDYGRTWKPYRYFAENCQAIFPNITTSPYSPSVPYCESRYSQSTPLTDGEVILRVISRNLTTLDPYSEEMQDLMRMTNLRLRFLKLHTLGDDLLDKRAEIQEKYYYAIYEMSVRGSCWCYGHSENCLPLNENVKNVQNMVHGRCDCSHDTTGLNCQFCKDTHNDAPWKPAVGTHTNACRKCNCNGHALKCKFDQDLYDKSGHISGSLCLDCEHNTMGHNCHLCKPGYYHDPGKSISDPYTCLECRCNADGTIDGGLCDPPADPYDPPQCHCKANVMGASCEQCKPGFWNLDPDNPLGCQACDCNPYGTMNSSCDPYSGHCPCKANVLGKECNQCAPEHFGLTEESDGCQPCECDIGGSVDSHCDVISGECKCLPHLSGRTCSEPQQSFFVRDLDLVFEAEDADCSQNCLVDVHEYTRANRTPSWTGRGYMRVYDNSELVFVVDNVPKSMEYDLIVRCDKVLRHEIIDIIATVERSDEKEGVCSNTPDSEDVKYIQLQAGEMYSKAPSSVCLEEGKQYKIRLTFKSNSNQIESTPASILIDSIALVPKVNSLDFLSRPPERIAEDYDRLGCSEYYNSPLRAQIPPKCQQYHYSISVNVFGGATECMCSQQGSVSSLCEADGGACTCKTKVVGRTCDRCAEGTYGYHFTEGCKDCDCNPVGAVDNICDVSTGQCNCNNGTYGRTCDECHPGSWGFPNCRPCECHGKAHTCNKYNGACIDCRDFTAGHYCDKCQDGYYGEPTQGLPCQPCRCPDTIESGHSFASTCVLRNDEVECICNEGYTGTRCDMCSNNYFGDPEKPGGSCQLCNCNDNIDFDTPGNCDPHTGKCLLCLNNTTGFNCESCQPDYFGDALQHNCSKCACDLLGTDKEKGPCDPVTGQCPCLPNVEGRQCNHCKENHCLIAKGTGCVPCDCDPIGSVSPDCNEFTGDCECRPGFGGSQCNKCQSNFWGDPNIQCHPCACNMEGSIKGDCYQNNGSCICNEGIGGEKCDVCARGYVGTAPYCAKCGECFDNWDIIINQLTDETNGVIQAASEIRRTGTAGYSDAFDGLTKRIDEVNGTLINTKSNMKKLESLEREVKDFRKELNETTEKVTVLSTEVQNVLSNISLANILLGNLNESAKALMTEAQSLSNNATNLQEKDLKGALNLTREAGEASKNVSAIENYIQSNLLKDAERKCKGTERLIYKDNDTFTSTEQKHESRREELEFQLSQLESKIPDLNKQLCDGHGDPCDNLCGGAGCGKCGGSISCESGAVGKAAAGLSLADQYEKQILTKLRSADTLYRDMSKAKTATENAKEAALKAHKTAEDLKMKFETTVKNISDMNNELNKFINTKGATPAEIRAVVNQTLQLNIKLQPEKIADLAKQINKTIDSLTNVSMIVESTKKDHEKANNLKKKADEAKNEAEKMLEKAQKVIDGLKAAKMAQTQAEDAITKANDDIDAIRKKLSQITSETGVAGYTVNSTKQDIEKIKIKLKGLQTGVLQNDYGAKQVSNEADNIAKQVRTSKNKVGDLKDQYKKVDANIKNRSKISDNSKSRAQKLLERARRLSLNTTEKLTELKDAESAYNQQDTKLSALTNKIKELTTLVTTYTDNISSKSEYYRDC